MTIGAPISDRLKRALGFPAGIKARADALAEAAEKELLDVLAGLQDIEAKLKQGTLFGS